MIRDGVGVTLSVRHDLKSWHWIIFLVDLLQIIST